MGTVCMGRKIQRCRARCGTQLGLGQHSTATTSQPDGRESQGEAKKKSNHPPSEQGDLQTGRQGPNGNKTGLVRQGRKRKRES